MSAYAVASRAWLYSATANAAKPVVVECSVIRSQGILREHMTSLPESAGWEVRALLVGPARRMLYVHCRADSAGEARERTWILEASTLRVIGSIAFAEAVSVPVWARPDTLVYRGSDQIGKGLVVRMDESGVRSKVYKVVKPDVTEAKHATEAAHLLQGRGYTWPPSPHGPREFTPRVFDNHAGLALISEDGNIVVTNARKDSSESELVLFRKHKTSWRLSSLGHVEPFPWLVMEGRYLACTTTRDHSRQCSLFDIGTRTTVSNFRADAVDISGMSRD